MSYDPLRAPDHAPLMPGPVDSELWLSRAFVAEVATANIHDTAEMIKAAAGLHYRLAALVAALDAERGGA
ncbi:hypothetical protein [Streptomyces sp. CRN 30]|uniref:hypothetical protein n=1 Tax=Streptomyces sp. CRN 30 TaxID=3075613 RepID=UPI002A82E08D|nr:hypothetical protein [Streptomyces sp. CRN 30]